MDVKFKNEDLRKRFGISHETVRQYTIEFSEFLSDGANPDTKGAHRVYTESDLRVFAVIVSMKNTNHTDDDIKATLNAGAEGELERLLDDDTVNLSPSMQIMLAKQQMNNLRTELEHSNSELQKWRDEANQLRGQIEQLKAQIDKQADTIELHQRIAVLEYQLKQLQDEDSNAK
ncbi:MAG: MerR family transcriptional regulator [Chloroflexota bacterium]